MKPIFKSLIASSDDCDPVPAVPLQPDGGKAGFMRQTGVSGRTGELPPKWSMGEYPGLVRDLDAIS